MKKAFVIMFAAILLLGVAGCADSRVSGTEASSTPDAEVSRDAGMSIEQKGQSALKEANASNIATGINAYNALNPDNILPDNATLAEVKEALEGSNMWPPNISDKDAENAWGLIEIKNGEAKVKK